MEIGAGVRDRARRCCVLPASGRFRRPATNGLRGTSKRARLDEGHGGAGLGCSG